MMFPFRAVLYAVVIGFLPASLFAEDARDSFKLQDFLGREWTNERVTWPVSKEVMERIKAGHALLSQDGAAVSYQLLPPQGAGESSRLAFLASLKPYESRSYQFSETPAAVATDLKVEDTADSIRIRNGRTGISIRKSLSGRQGPIEGFLLKSGEWVGESLLEGESIVSGYSASLVSSGPVSAEILVQASFGEAGTWKVRFVLQSGEPVVLIDEQFTHCDKDLRWVFVPSGGRFVPDSLCFRNFANLYPGGPSSAIKMPKITADEKGRRILDMDPWVRWWDMRSVKWFGLWAAESTDFMLLAARDSEVWVDPAKAPEARTPSPQLVLEGDRPIFSLPLRDGKRHWMLGSFDVGPTREMAASEHPGRAPEPQDYVIKSEFPLDRIKDYVLSWKETEDHPRLVITSSQLERFREKFQRDDAALTLAISNASANFDTLITLFDDIILQYVGTGDRKLGAVLAKAAEESMQFTADYFLKQELVYTLGVAPPQQRRLLTALHLNDLMFSSGLLSEQQRERIRAQAAFVGYTLMRPDYWSPDRGFSANPNMTTMVAAYQTAIGSFIQSHPKAKEWAETGLAELRLEAEEWSDENGGWIEAPHYAMVSYDLILGSFVMAKNSGYSDDVFRPKMRKAIEWFAKISTPPDSRFDGLRHLPPIGNTYRFESSGMFGNVATLWKERDPKFASEMQWMFRQQGSRPEPICGGASEILSGYRKIFVDPEIPESVPVYGSERFPGTGIVLRSHFGTPRETMLHMIGSHNDHYDRDSGSLTLWGKGSIIADDFGYGSDAVEERYHSMLDTPYAAGVRMVVKDDGFVPGEYLDYIRGTAGGWTRQVLFMKDADPLGPNYFVVADTQRGGSSSAKWRLWLSDKQITLGGRSALASGKDDVDTELYFLAPSNVALQTEDHTGHTYGLSSGGVYGHVSVPQTAVVASGSSARNFNVLIYPRLKSEAPPVITSLADGRGLKIVTPSGTDYVFVGDEPFRYRDGEISFEGKAGAIQIRPLRRTLSLAAGGKISVGKHKLESDKAASRSW